MNIFGTLNDSITTKHNSQDQKLDVFMQQTAQLFKARSEDSQRRGYESVQRDVQTREHFQQALNVRDCESKVLARDQLAMTSQIQHLTTTVSQLRDQLSAQADFAVDAIQQVRDEVTGDRTHPGGEERPEVEPSCSNSGKPNQNTSIPGPYSVTCAYCDGDVPKIIAKQCQDCEAFFRPAHYPAHREEWPCPNSNENWCL